MSQKLLQNALDTRPTIIGQPNDDNHLAMKEKLLLDVLQTIFYDRADGFHHVIRVMQRESAYMANHTGIAFPIPKCLGLWDDKIAKDVTVVEMKKAEAIQKACSKDYKIWKTAEYCCKKLIRAAVEEVNINRLKDGPRSSPRSLHVTSLNTWRKTLLVSTLSTLSYCTRTCSSSTITL
jgi:hypothetical protein